MPLILGSRSVKGWYSGTSIDSQQTLAFSALTGVRPMTEIYPLERAAEAYDRMMSGDARFRRRADNRPLTGFMLPALVAMLGRSRMRGDLFR